MTDHTPMPPGTKDAEWWEANVGCAPTFTHPFEELYMRMDLGIIDLVEAEEIERHYSMLTPDQPEACDVAATTAKFGAMKLAAADIRAICRQLTFAVRWHSWRERPALAERYSMLASGMRALMDET